MMRAVAAPVLLVVAVLAAACDPPAVPRGRALSVMSINLRHDVDFYDERMELLADEIARLKPDLVGMQEVEIGVEQGARLVEMVRARDAALSYHYDDRLKSGAAEFGGEGIGVLSRFPIVERASVSLGEGRVALFDRVQVDDGLLVDLYDTHLHSEGGPEGDEVRRQQALAVLDFMDEHAAGHPTFLTGDMNATDDQPAIAAFVDAGLVDTWRALRADEPGATSPIRLLKDPAFVQDPRRRIDYVFSDGDPRVVLADSIVCFDAPNGEGLYPSDHLGVMTTALVRWDVAPQP